jgi:hypothetical protein
MQSNPVKAKKFIVITGVINTLLAALPLVIAVIVIPMFKELFEGFGADLPLVTTLYIRWHFLLIILPILVASFYRFYALKNFLVLNWKIIFCSVLSIHLMLCMVFAFVGLSINAMYSPIFELGAPQ